ncbi:oxepin-CoA hydrolase, alternative type [Jannaschia formosa]|uniref:oxepin-CoA hydrolase, alternative type n=1 Tax=Jannaschia formosa TaxID=2259592 RepID=UPI000E1BC032|nr:enoyl-CoA hydratase family protein [Jannaschia formosa]TFL18057.1 enoyl-CoA hydratase [Jannaschia formosa]
MTGRIDDLGDRLVVTNENPGKRNALTPAYYDALNDALETARDPRIGAVILRGAGGYFCAGGNLAALATRRDLPRAGRLAKIGALHDLVAAIRACPAPVIAAVEGGAAGAGASIAFACDLVVAAEDARFTAAYVKAGLVPDGGLTAALAMLVPRATAMRMALLGDPVTAARLHALGAISDLCAPGTAEAAAHALADRLCTGPRVTQGLIKRLVADAYGDPAAQAERERQAMADAQASPEGMAGIDAFLAKRKPAWP